MNIYLVNNSPTDILASLREAKVNIWSRLTTGITITGFTLNALERTDAIILEIAYPSDELHYILAQAIVLQRPTLCLFPKNREPRELLQYLQKPSVPKTISAKCYTATTINEILNKFIQSVDQTVSLEDAPNIKFTVRLTTSIDHYLTWLAKQQQINKADYIRKLLKDDAECNADYQRLL